MKKNLRHVLGFTTLNLIWKCNKWKKNKNKIYSNLKTRNCFSIESIFVEIWMKLAKQTWLLFFVVLVSQTKWCMFPIWDKTFLGSIFVEGRGNKCVKNWNVLFINAQNGESPRFKQSNPTNIAKKILCQLKILDLAIFFNPLPKIPKRGIYKIGKKQLIAEKILLQNTKERSFRMKWCFGCST